MCLRIPRAQGRCEDFAVDKKSGAISIKKYVCTEHLPVQTQIRWRAVPEADPFRHLARAGSSYFQGEDGKSQFHGLPVIAASVRRQTVVPDLTRFSAFDGN